MSGLLAGKVWGSAPFTVTEAALILRWLADNPSEAQTIITLAEMDTGRDPTWHHADDPLRPELVRQEQHVQAWMETGRLRACDRCMQPLIVFANGHAIDWPELVLHICRKPHESHVPVPPVPKTPSYQLAGDI